MGLEYVVTKRVFGFDKDKNEKYVAKSVRSGKVNFAKMCRKVSELCGVHRKVVDLVVSGLVDKMAEDIDDGKSVQMVSLVSSLLLSVLRVRMTKGGLIQVDRSEKDLILSGKNLQKYAGRYEYYPPCGN